MQRASIEAAAAFGLERKFPKHEANFSGIDIFN
jgi:hypothetical protein